MKFKIGEFSKLCHVTVKTLRHYEQIGLLTPLEVDEWTGYRYYDIGQLRRMAPITYLKRLGFSLEEISELLEQRFSRTVADGNSTVCETIKCRKNGEK